MKFKALASRLFDRNPPAASGEVLGEWETQYQQHVDNNQQVTDSSWQNEKSHREIHFAFLPERYEPLVDDEAKEERKRRNKENYKKVKKLPCGSRSNQECCQGAPLYLEVSDAWSVQFRPRVFYPDYSGYVCP